MLTLAAIAKARDWFGSPDCPRWEDELSVAVEGKETLVTPLGTNCAVTYFKRDGAFGLLAKDICSRPSADNSRSRS